jgi:hypothetical protein
MKWIILGLLLIIALVLFPTLHWGIDSIDTTGFMPLFAMTTAALPYAFIGLVVWFVAKNK